VEFKLLTAESINNCANLISQYQKHDGSKWSNHAFVPLQFIMRKRKKCIAQIFAIKPGV